ncbi:ras-associating and dilute domain-containing protein isoform X2 [Bos indicus x Bos taurus]|nr:ras-associating and dilute domain-containing protein isoform X2 [Bos indicus x Bos taurus]XP_027382410.1 ras-associating and dilute domain-containing protein isoform X2 [Bos indicus x Bos taurus]XP_027382411.1 ras-associating and dilute domain-containing protein isoform X2 [Bos indicus x Bos taurus]XP_027382412.1 ras-associating and dilute domain-containing protein isoform X2 [Bos indicus x Bos taurus]
MNHRVPAHKRYQPTEYEHAANCATHALWIIPSILGSSNLYFLSDDDWEAISAWIYGLGLCGLFVVSTVFHTISWKKSHLRTVEHCLHMSDRMVIYFFIAASYAPWLNLRELGPWASHMRWLVWIMASVGTVYVFFFHERYKLVELLCYVIMGFFPALVVLSMPDTEGIWELVTGGVFYCLGMVFFKSDGRIPFAHAIWHLFVAFGAGTHYYAIWRTRPLPCRWPESRVLVGEDEPTMFYGTHFIMSPPAKSKLKRQGQLLSSVLSRTLSYKYRDLDTPYSGLGASDDPAELSTQLSAPGVLKVFGDSVCSGTHYKSVLATGTSSARELVREALERYALSPERAAQFVLCDVVGQASGGGHAWQAQGFRVFGDNEKPLLIQELWKPREGLSRRFELRKRSEVEELAAKDVDTMTAGINAQARRLQRSRAKGTPAPAAGGTRSPPPPRLRRTVSETSLSSASTRDPEEPGRDTMRCSLYESPHLLLLQGYSQQHDSLVYVLNRERHTVGQRTPSSKPSISLSAPDILPLHCTLRRRQPSGQGPAGAQLVLEPLPGAPVAVNFAEVGARPVALRHGDLLSLGLYYLLLFKDPAQAQPLPAQALARLRTAPQSCRLCGALLRARGAPAPARPALPRPRPLQLEFEPDVEDTLLQRIMTLIEPDGDDHKLTPAFLLCLCIQHSATRLEPGSFGQLLLKIARLIRETVWEKTKELAEKQAHLPEPPSAASFSLAGLAPDLQHILFWMSNSVELLYFVQQRCPLYMQSLEEELDVTGSKESLFSCALTASEEAMAVLEEVVLYAFQQCIYYVSKALYVCLPALLECPPFQSERRESWSAGPPLPEELRRVVAVYQAALDLLRRLHVHPEVAAQVLAYLFFFSGTLLLNQLLDKGPSLSCFHWPRGVQACARLQQLLEWIRSAGFGEAGERFFRKLSCTLNLLATPSAQLIQMSWASLRAAFPALSPAQLHRLLTQYQLASAMGPMSAWEPGAQDGPAAFKSEEVLESYENPPPIVLPSEGFQVDLDTECPDDRVYQHLLYIRHFLCGLRSQPGPSGAPTRPEGLQGLHHASPEGHPEAQSCPLASRDPTGGAQETGLEHPLSSVGGPWAQGVPGRPPGCPSHGGLQAVDPHGDPSCLLTPPGTPLGLDPAAPDWPEGSSACRRALPEGRRTGPGGPRGASREGDCAALEDEPPPAPSSHSSSTDDFCYMFVVELERGPSGLGMGLIDGMHTPLGAPGLYIQTLLPGSPAAADGRLALGDRILEVNGSSLAGVSYPRAVDLIRHGGKKMRFLVAKSDVETARKVRFRTPPP